MEVSLQNSDGLERRLQIAVPEEDISPQIQNKLEQLSRTTRVQGFRPGKVPMKVIRSRFGAQVRQEVIGEVVQTTFQEAVTQEKLRPAGMPTIDPLSAEDGQGLSYTATFEVYPDLELAPAENIEIERPVAKITDDDIEKMIERLRKQNGTLESCDRVATEGDTLVIDFTGKLDGEEFQGGTAEDFEIELGSERLIDGFEQGLLGAKAGESRDLDLTFPDEYQKSDLAGKAVTFSVTVKDVKTTKLPELDDDFFKLFGVNEGGLEAFKSEVRNNMEREAERSAQNRVRDVVLDKLFEHNQFESPKVMLEAESRKLHDEMKQRFQSQGMDPAQLDQIGPETYLEQAKKRVALQLILSEIIKQNDMQADPDKVRTLIEQHAVNYQDPAAIINWYYADKNRLAEVEALALERDVVDFLMSKCKVKEAEISFDEIMNTGQTGAA